MTQLAYRYTDEECDEEVPSARQSIFPKWMIDAACVGMEDTVFFGSSDPNKRPQYTITQIKEARKVCAGCVIAKTCLKTSLENRDEYGVFAGSTKKNRTEMLRRIESGVTTMDDEVVTFLTWLKETVDG